MSVFVLPLSRILLSLLFIFDGYTKVIGWGPADKPIMNMDMWKTRVLGLKIPGTQEALPNPELLAQIAAWGELVGGGLLLLGILSRVSAFGLFVFTIVASVLGHVFWQYADATKFYQELDLFLRNMGIAAGLLMIVGMGGGAVGIDGMFRRQS